MAKSAANMALVRLLTDGTRDASFDSQQRLSTRFNDNHRVQSLALQSNGRLIAVGGYGLDIDGRDHSMFAFASIRTAQSMLLLPTWHSLREHGGKLGLRGRSICVLIQPDNKIVMSVRFAALGSGPAQCVSIPMVRWIQVLEWAVLRYETTVIALSAVVPCCWPMAACWSLLIDKSHATPALASSIGALASGGVLDAAGTIYAARLESDGKFLIGGTFLGDSESSGLCLTGSWTSPFSYDGMVLIPIGPARISLPTRRCNAMPAGCGR